MSNDVFGDDFGDDREDFFAEGDDFGFDDDFGDDFGELDLPGDEDAPEFGDETYFEDNEVAQRRTIFGLNRGFVLIAGIIAIIICLAAGGLVITLLNNAGPSDVDLTITSVYATNTFVAYALDLTETQNAVSAGETATAEAWTDTPTPTATPTDTPTPTEPPFTPTQQIIFVTPTPDGDGQGGGGITAEDVAQTATALAAILAGGTPTPEVIDGGVTEQPGFVTPTPATSLPTTGLFDEIGGGGGTNSLATVALLALGLMGVIVVARRLRR